MGIETNDAWHLTIEESRFDKLKAEERFWQLTTLSRAVNALRFAHSTLLAHTRDDDSPRAKRTRFNSFFFNCGLLYEALLFLQRLGKHYHDVPEFKKLYEILRDPVAIRLRDSNFDRVRNTLLFHFSEGEAGLQLATTQHVPPFVSAEGSENANVYYELADLCTLGAFAGTRLDDPNLLEKIKRLMQETTDISLRFMNAAEEFIVSVLRSDGWEMRDQNGNPL